MLDQIARLQAELDQIEKLMDTEDALRETLPEAQVDGMMHSWREQAEELKGKMTVLGNVTDSQMTQGRGNKVAQAREGGIVIVSEGDVNLTLTSKDNLGNKGPAHQSPLASFIAHEYTLDRTYGFVGRQVELEQVTNWASRPNSPSILNIVAIGGMGKSALTWHWFNEIASEVIKPLAGRLWWSFYKRDATFEQFLTHALAYVSQQPRGQVQQISRYEQERQLLDILNQTPFLLVLDGLERLLLAYARHDAAYLRDDDPSLRHDDYRMSKAADWRVGNFLRRLATVKASRILVSTRLYPADLRDKYTGDMIPNSYLELGGLSDNDALALWAKMGLGGENFELLRLFHTFDNHPLVLQALAGAIKRYRRAPNNFKQWAKDHPTFNPFGIRNVQKAMAHVLGFALGTLSAPLRQTLHTIAAFRMPTTYDTLTALLVGNNKLFAYEDDLDSALSELEERGLLGWDKRTNRYDLHPIVRGVTWNRLDDTAKQHVYEALHTHFSTRPSIYKWQVKNFDDLTPTIELYNILIGLGHYSEAFQIFDNRLDYITLYHLSANRQRVGLLEMFFPNGLGQLNYEEQSQILYVLALSYHRSDQPKKAIKLYIRAKELHQRINDIETQSFSRIISNLAGALRLSGALYKSESAARQALLLDIKFKFRFRQIVSLGYLGLGVAARGAINDAEVILNLARKISERYNTRFEGVILADLVQWAIWSQASFVTSFANRAWELALKWQFERDVIRAGGLQGIVALSVGDLLTASEHLHRALVRARSVNHMEEELQLLIALAELRRRQNNLAAARDLLDDVWEPAERGPYPLFHADALNVLAEIERDRGNMDAAIRAATQAYRLAWCDGPPFAYHWGLQKAKAHLTALGAPFPDLPAFDPSKYEPMPEVEINPLDEFYVPEQQL